MATIAITQQKAHRPLVLYTNQPMKLERAPFLSRVSLKQQFKLQFPSKGRLILLRILLLFIDTTLCESRFPHLSTRGKGSGRSLPARRSWDSGCGRPALKVTRFATEASHSHHAKAAAFQRARLTLGASHLSSVLVPLPGCPVFPGLLPHFPGQSRASISFPRNHA